MPKILISYRQESAAHTQQVTALAMRLRDRLAPLDIEIVLGQFYRRPKARKGGPRR
jgi:hypothetical protein